MNDIFLFLLFASAVYGHPQCLDFKPPFEPNFSNITLCTDYNLFGCCNDDTEIVARHRNILQALSAEEIDRCNSFITNILCQKCSPFAAHLYFAEATMQSSSFPSLCPSYFNQFSSTCSSLLPYLSATQPVPTGDPNYCYPDILNDTENLGQIGSQGNCKQLCVKEVAIDLYSPVAGKPANDGTQRFFVAEQRGTVLVYLRDFTRLPTPFIDIRNKVYETGRRYEELGLLDIAFHPNFINNKKFYLYYTVRSSGRVFVKISEFTVFPTDNNRGDEDSERVVIEIDQFANNHNGGSILFKDGLLYIFTGDGGGANDPRSNGQNKKTLLGKVLRINVDNYTESEGYSIPPDNPFVGDDGARDELWALGLRNPWRCTLDRGDPDTNEGKGRIFCGDVGQNAVEEVDLITRGSNYGWNRYEGNDCFISCSTLSNHTPPITTYRHSVGRSITGGYVYRGCDSPNLRGKYLFGDWSNGRLFYLELTDGQWTRQDVCIGNDDVCVNNGLSSAYGRFINSFAEDESGEIYMLTTRVASSTSNSGGIYQLVDPSERGNPDLCQNTVVVVSPAPTQPTDSPRDIIIAVSSILFFILVALCLGKRVTSRRSLVESEKTLSRRIRIRRTRRGRQHIGLVEVLGPNGVWGNICSSGWNWKSARVFCKGLRHTLRQRKISYRRGASLTYRSFYGIPTKDFWINRISCEGSESSIFECSHSGGVGRESCPSRKPAAVYCYRRYYV